MSARGPVFVTGGSGFVGRAVIRELLGRGFAVHALVNRSPVECDGVRSFAGGMFDPRGVQAALAGCSAAIHLIGIIRETPAEQVTFERIHVQGTRSIIEAAGRAGVRRWVHMSALGTREDARSRYHRSKWAAEQIVRGGSLDWTILRPSIIHGPEGEFTRMEAAWALKRKPPWLFMPYFGRGVLGQGGSGRVAPVYVADVARAFVDALEKPATVGRAYALAGDEVMSWPQMHRVFSEAITGRPRATAAIPAWYGKLLARTLPAALLPFNYEQVIMAEEDNIGDVEPFAADFGWRPRGLRRALGEYAADLRAESASAAHRRQTRGTRGA